MSTKNIFNQKYELLKSLGEGMAAKVYLAHTLEDQEKVAIKILKTNSRMSHKMAIEALKPEILALDKLSHSGIVKMLDYGYDGTLEKKSGRVIENLVFVVMEYVEGGLFDLCQAVGGFGEDAGRFFMNQMLDSIEHMHSKNIVHRDLKPENILVDSDLNLKIADFGFATHKNTD